MDQGAGPAQVSEITTRAASSLIRVADVDRSVKFYSDVFSCRVIVQEPDIALLLAPNGFQLYLHATPRPRRQGSDSIGAQQLMWATDTEAELDQIAQRLRAYDPATYSHSENGLTFVEGCDPDGGRVIVAYPSPSRLPRELIASRLRGVVRPRRARVFGKKRTG